MIASALFIFTRIVQIVFLIPIIGMMAYFVNGFLNANTITPAYILVLFIVSVIAVFWSLDTVIRYRSARNSAIFVCFLDLCFCGAFIAGVYELRFIGNDNCAHWDPVNDSYSLYVSLGPFGKLGYETGNHLALHINKTCAMLKTCFALGIMEIVFFFWTAVLAYFIYEPRKVVKETVEVRKRRSGSGGHGRHHHRHRSGSGGHRRSHSSHRQEYEV